MKKLIAVGIATALLCILQTGCSGDAVVKEVADQVANAVQAEDENVLGVKGGEPFDYPGKTYGEAFENFFASPTWKYFKGTQEGPDEDGDGKPDYTKEDVDVVEFTGYCTYMDTTVKARIQFVLDKENDTFEATYLSFNDVPQNNLTLWALIDKAFTDGDSADGQNQDSEEGGFTFADLSKYSFNFSSGAGAWGTGLEINADGSFVGGYHDSDMGSTGPGYPNGTVYICNFNGQFTQLKKVNEYTYSMKLEELKYERAAGIEEIENGVKYIYSEAYGVEGGDEFLIYLPGAPVSELPEEFVMWVQFDISGASKLSSYALCNVARQYGFWGYIEEESDSDAGAAQQEVPQQEMIPGEDYTNYYSWLGEYNSGETELSFQIFSDGVQYTDGYCGYIAMRHRGAEVKGDMYYMGGNKFRWEEEIGSEKKVSYVYPVMNNGKRQLEMYDSNGVYYDTYTVYFQQPWVTG